MQTKNQNLKEVFSKILEPFALGLLALLFIIPTITVMNLTPLTQQLKKLDVLGVTSNEEISLTLVGGKHEIFTSENLNKKDSNTHLYSTTLNKRGADNYSKPIIEIENKSSETKTLKIWGQTISNTKSKISLIIGEKSFVLQNSNGNTYTQDISIKPTEKTILFLSIENLSGVQFSEMFDLTIVEDKENIE